MTAFNAVRFRVKPGREQDFLDAHKKVQADWPGLKHANIIKTGERTFCIIAEWTDMDSLAKARSNMIATLDCFATRSKTSAVASVSPILYRGR
jgi:antibiotic biosynthesis monooxygenase (ABM) superfamily enzyme